MFGLEDENKREAISFLIKQATMIIAAISVLLFGTAHLGKMDLEQMLKSKLVGSTNILGLTHGEYYAPGKETKYCFVSGSYQIQNIGKYPFFVKSVSIELWELPYISDELLNDDKPISYALSERVQGKGVLPARQVGDTVEIDVGEQYGIGNYLQRSFGFIVPVSNKGYFKDGNSSSFIIIANAVAELDERVPWYSRVTHYIAGDPGIGFLPNDLRHMTKTFNLCENFKS